MRETVVVKSLVLLFRARGGIRPLDEVLLAHLLEQTVQRSGSYDGAALKLLVYVLHDAKAMASLGPKT